MKTENPTETCTANSSQQHLRMNPVKHSRLTLYLQLETPQGLEIQTETCRSEDRREGKKRETENPTETCTANSSQQHLRMNTVKHSRLTLYLQLETPQGIEIQTETWTASSSRQNQKPETENQTET